MTMNEAKVWFQHPAYFLSEWTTRNPLLLPGEIAFIKEDVTELVKTCKVGPGYFNTLGYFNDIYPYTDTVLNEIGDATGDLHGLSIVEILYRMLNPYQTPMVSNQRNNANGAYLKDQYFEIGQSLSGPIVLLADISNIANLVAPTPINIDAAGSFNNEGGFADFPISMNFVSPYNPASLSKITIKIKVTHLRGISEEVITTINHSPKILWGVSASAVLSPTDWASISLRRTLITDNFEQDYDFNSIGYAHLAIPTMLAPGTLNFGDVMNPVTPVPYSVVDLGQQTINNGVATYAYQHYRSEFFMNVATKMRVRK